MYEAPLNAYYNQRFFFVLQVGVNYEAKKIKKYLVS